MNNTPHYETLQEQLKAQQEALVKIYQSAEKTRKIMFWSGILNIIVFVLPLIFFAVALPSIINTLTGNLNSFTGSDAGIIDNALNNPSLSESLKNLQNLGF